MGCPGPPHAPGTVHLRLGAALRPLRGAARLAAAPLSPVRVCICPVPQTLEEDRSLWEGSPLAAQPPPESRASSSSNSHASGRHCVQPTTRAARSPTQLYPGAPVCSAFPRSTTSVCGPGPQEQRQAQCGLWGTLLSLLMCSGRHSRVLEVGAGLPAAHPRGL